jgi:hypothetical protein
VARGSVLNRRLASAKRNLLAFFGGTVSRGLEREPPFSGASLPDGLELGLGVSDQIAAGNIKPATAL